MFNPQGTYKEKAQIGFYECDLTLHQRPACLVRRTQELSEKQLEELGIGYRTLLEQHSQVFLLSQLLLRIKQLPVESQTIEMVTCPMGSKGARLYRETHVQDEAGQPMAEVYTSWSLFDPVARQVLRPTAFSYELPNGTLELNPRELRFKTPQGQLAGRREVRYSDLDANGHMNNAIYLDVVCDALPLERMQGNKLEEIYIYYHHELAHGDTIDLFSADEGDLVTYIYGEANGQRCFEAKAVFRP